MADSVHTDNQLIGSRIREARLKKKMSQAELAAKANLSLPHISSIELGKTNLMLSSFIRITEALQVSADSLIRSNVPAVNELYQNEFAEILSDCSPKELNSIMKIVRELKATMLKKDEEY